MISSEISKLIVNKRIVKIELVEFFDPESAMVSAFNRYSFYL